GVAVLVVGGALVRVGEHLVGLLGLLELLFRLLRIVTLVAVRVVLHGQLAVGLLDVVLAGVLRNAEDFVVVTLCHGVGCRLNAKPPCAFAAHGGDLQGARALFLVLDFLEFGVDHVVVGRPRFGMRRRLGAGALGGAGGLRSGLRVGVHL